MGIRASSAPSGNAWGSGSHDMRSGEVALPPPPQAFIHTPPGMPPFVRVTPKAPRGRGKAAALIAILATLACVWIIGAVVVVAKTRRPSQTSAAAPTAVAVASTMSTAAAPPTDSAAPVEAQIEFTIKASPADAKIFLDDSPLGANPATGKRQRDGAMHHLRIEAPGHDPREESVAFDRSLFITVELRPSAATWEAPATTGGTPRAGRSLRPTRAPRAHAPGGKSLDSENPYQ
jgi:hypothetical protein